RAWRRSNGITRPNWTSANYGGTAANALADTGYFSAEAVATVESNGGPTTYVAVEKTGHHRTIADLLAVPEPETPATGPIDRDAMRRRLRTAVGRTAYNFRRLARLIPAATTRCHGDFALQPA
ncbi:MAG: hypothetical protein WCI17_09275, partial [bacterium]